MTANSVAALAEELTELTDEPMWSAIVVVKRLLASPVMRDLLAEVWDEGYSTCLGDFDIAARREARSSNPYDEEQS